jgi:hypothetical protein
LVSELRRIIPDGGGDGEGGETEGGGEGGQIEGGGGGGVLMGRRE